METAHSFAFLDINPLSEGHCLVVPKKHHEFIYTVSQEEMQDLMEVVRQVCAKLKKEFNSPGLNVLQNNAKIANQHVPHVHVHIIPKYERSGLVIEWNPLQKSKEELEQLQEKLAL